MDSVRSTSRASSSRVGGATETAGVTTTNASNKHEDNSFPTFNMRPPWRFNRQCFGFELRITFQKDWQPVKTISEVRILISPQRIGSESRWVNLSGNACSNRRWSIIGNRSRDRE